MHAEMQGDLKQLFPRTQEGVSDAGTKLIAAIATEVKEVP